MKRLTLLFLGTSLMAGGLPVHAHHSYAMFDGAKPREAAATVARVEWRNPHVLLWLYETPADRKPVLVVLESDSVNALIALGWSRESLRVGDAIRVRYFPHRDGRPAGHLDYALAADGRRLEGIRGVVATIERDARSEGRP